MALKNSMEKDKKWFIIDNSSKKSKSWITKEYNNPHTNETILVYNDTKSGFGWRVWKGLTSGKNLGEYKSFKNKSQALKYSEKIRR